VEVGWGTEDDGLGTGRWVGRVADRRRGDAGVGEEMKANFGVQKGGCEEIEKVYWEVSRVQGNLKHSKVDHAYHRASHKK